MLTAIKQRRDREDEGFTLIELMVVVLIIAILLAIAIPTFLGARNAANARAAQSNLRNALTAEQTEWTNAQTFSSNTTTMGGIESALHWMDGSASGAQIASTDTNANEVLALTSDAGQIVVVTALGKDNKCYSIGQVNDPSDSSFEGTQYYATPATSSGGAYTCTNPAAPSAAAGYTSATGNPGHWASAF